MTNNRKEGVLIDAHPGGISLTIQLLALAAEKVPSMVSGRPSFGKKLLDLGAGEGESLSYLQEVGYEALGIDLYIDEKKNQIKKMDMRALSFPSEAFDVCLAECSLSGCGDGELALREAARVLKPEGLLLVSDVFFQKEEAPTLSMKAPLTREGWLGAFASAGFLLRSWKDETPLWKEFFIESLWNGKADEGCIEKFREYGKAKCGYFLAVLQKGETYGSGNGSV